MKIDQYPIRLDVYVSKIKKNMSRAVAAKLIKDNSVLVNNLPVNKPSMLIKESDKVKINTKIKLIKTKKLNIPVIYEDEDCVVINKPSGVLSHSKGEYNEEGSVATWLSDKVVGLKGNRAGIVHRLDRPTSGLMICAKNKDALNWLQKQFADKKVKKSYMAIVVGSNLDKHFIIKLPIERNPKKPSSFRVGKFGKKAETECEVIKTNEKYSLVKLTPKTGRTHQLRVHMSYIGHPILGDLTYSKTKADRLYLHAIFLELILPNRKLTSFNLGLPKEFNTII